MNGALKSFSLNNLFSCELAAVTQMDSEMVWASKLCIIYFCISQMQKKKKNEKMKKKMKKKKKNIAKRKEDHVERS